MKAQHTPGPWQICNQSPSGAANISAAGVPLLKIYADRNGHANASLIAAAPELLAVLEALCEIQETGSVAELAPEWDVAITAIAKARG